MKKDIKEDSKENDIDNSIVKNPDWYLIGAVLLLSITVGYIIYKNSSSEPGSESELPSIKIYQYEFKIEKHQPALQELTIGNGEIIIQLNPIDTFSINDYEIKINLDYKKKKFLNMNRKLIELNSFVYSIDYDLFVYLRKNYTEQKNSPLGWENADVGSRANLKRDIQSVGSNPYVILFIELTKKKGVQQKKFIYKVLTLSKSGLLPEDW